MTINDCRVETYKHIEKVRKYIRFFTDKLTTRAVKHDLAKLDTPEVEIFTEHTEALKETTYNSPEYQEHLAAMKVALDHHYATYRHHPEHFQNGINDMNLVDLVEMIADWKAASERQHDGNLLTSIEQNAIRFKMSDQLKQILINTAKMLDESENE